MLVWLISQSDARMTNVFMVLAYLCSIRGTAFPTDISSDTCTHRLKMFPCAGKCKMPLNEDFGNKFAFHLSND